MAAGSGVNLMDFRSAAVCALNVSYGSIEDVRRLIRSPRRRARAAMMELLIRVLWRVLRLIASWYFVGACAGRLAGSRLSKMYRIEALLQNKTSMITASTATIRRRSIPLGFEAALSRTGTEASVRACARSESAASEAVTSWAGSARKPSRARALSLPGWP